MSDEVKKVKKQVEVEVVELKIQLDEQFFANMEKAKKQVADQRGYDVSYGEYIQEAMNDLVQMVGELQDKVIEASQIIQKQDEALGAAEVVSGAVEDKDDDEPKTAEGVPSDLYAHLAENYSNDPMVG